MFFRQFPLCQKAPWGVPGLEPSIAKKSVLVPPMTQWVAMSMRLNWPVSVSRPALKLVLASPGTVLVMLTVSSERSTCMTNTAWGFAT